MAWAEEQWWFGLEDVVLERGLFDLDDLVENIDVNHYDIAENARSLFLNYHIWVGKGRKKTYNLSEMDETHIKNCIKMIKEGRLNREWALPIFEDELKRRKNDS